MDPSLNHEYKTIVLAFDPGSQTEEQAQLKGRSLTTFIQKLSALTDVAPTSNGVAGFGDRSDEEGVARGLIPGCCPCVQRQGIAFGSFGDFFRYDTSGGPEAVATAVATLTADILHEFIPLKQNGCVGCGKKNAPKAHKEEEWELVDVEGTSLESNPCVVARTLTPTKWRIVLLIQAAVKEGPSVMSNGGGGSEKESEKDLLFFPPQRKPPYLRLRMLLTGLRAAVEQLTDCPGAAKAKQGEEPVRHPSGQSELRIICVIDPTLSDQLCPLPMQRIEATIQRILDSTFIKAPNSSTDRGVNYSCVDCCVLFPAVRSQALRTRIKESTLPKDGAAEEVNHEEGTAEYTTSISPKAPRFLEVLALCLQLVYEETSPDALDPPQGADSPKGLLLSAQLVRHCNKYLGQMALVMRRKMHQIMPDWMELTVVSISAGPTSVGVRVATGFETVDDILCLTISQRQTLRSGFAFFPSAATMLEGLFPHERAPPPATVLEPSPQPTFRGPVSQRYHHPLEPAFHPMHSWRSRLNPESSTPLIYIGAHPSPQTGGAAPSKASDDLSNTLYGVIYIGQHPSPHTDGSGRRHCLTCAKELTAQESWADHIAMPSHLEKAGEYKAVADVDGRVPQPHYMCIICHAVISGDKDRSLHVEGLRHRRRKELMKVCPTCNYIFCSQDENFAHKEYICGKRHLQFSGMQSNQVAQGHTGQPVRTGTIIAP
jgi:hypothetical protein